MLTGALYKGRFSEFDTLMAKWIAFLRKEALTDSATVKAAYFDALPFNIIVDKGSDFKLFDQEWAVKESFDLPFLGFVNRALQACSLEKISNSKLKKYQALDEQIRSKVNRIGGLAPLQITKSLVFLALHKLKEIKTYLKFGIFAQR